MIDVVNLRVAVRNVDIAFATHDVSAPSLRRCIESQSTAINVWEALRETKWRERCTLNALGIKTK